MKTKNVKKVLVSMLLVIFTISLAACSGCVIQELPTETYTLTFSDGIGGDPITMEKEEKTVLSLPENTFTREGWTFVGWQLGEEVYAEGQAYTVTGSADFVAKWSLNAPEIGQPEFSQFDYDYDRVGGKDMELPLDLKGATLHFVEVDGELIDDSDFTYDYETGCLVIFEAIAIQLDNGLHTVKIITDAANAKPAICQVFVDNSIKTTFDEITTKSFVYGKDDGVTFAVGYNGSSVKSIKQGDITLSPEFYEIGESSITIKSEWLRRSSDLGEYTLSLTNFDSYTFTITTNVIFYTDYDLVTIHDETVSSAGQNSLYQDSTRVEIVDGPDAMDGKVLQITPHTVGGHEVYHGYYTLRSPSLPSTWKDVGFEGNYFLVEFDYLTEGTSVGTFGYQSVTTSWREDLLLGSSNDGVVHHFKSIVSKEEVGGGVYLYAFFENGGGKIYVDNFSITELDEVPVLVAPENYEREGDLQLSLQAKGYAYVKTLIDGNEIAATYDPASGAITIEKSLLDQIESGAHTVTVETKLGSISAVVRIQDSGVAVLKDTSVNYAYGVDESVKLFGTFSEGVRLVSLKQLEKVVDSTYAGWDFATCDTESNFASLANLITGENDSGYIQLPSSFLDKFYGSTQFVAEFSNGVSAEFTVNSDVAIFSNFDESTVNGDLGTPMHSGLRGNATITELESGNKAWIITSTAGSGAYACAFTVEFDVNVNSWFRVVGEESKLYRISFTYQITGLAQNSVYFCLAGPNGEIIDNNIFGKYDGIEPWNDVGGYIARYNLIADGEVHTFDTGWFTYNAAVRMTKIQLPEFGADANASFMVDDYRITQTTGISNPVASLPDYTIAQENDFAFDSAYQVIAITIDGNEIQYSQLENKVTLSKQTMDVLSVGAHSMIVETTQGAFRGEFNVKEKGVAVLKDTIANYAYGVDESVKLFGTFSEGVRLVSLKQLAKIVDGNLAGWNFSQSDTSLNLADQIAFATGLDDTGYIELSKAFLDKFFGSTQFVAEFSNGDQVTFTINSDVVIFSNFDESTVIGDVGSPMHSGLAGSVEIKEVKGSKAWILSSMTGYPTAFTVEFDAQSNAWFGIKADSSKLYRITFTYQITGLAQDSVYFCLAGPNGEIIDNNIFGKYDGIEPWNDVGGYIARYNLIADGEVHTFDTGWFTYNAAVRMTKIQLPAFSAESGSSVIIDDYRITQTTGISNPVASLPDYNVQQTSSYGFECAKPVESLKIDGTDFAFTQEGSTVALSIEAMDQLTVGSHNVEVITADGIFRGSILVKFNTVATLNETSKAVTVGGGDVLLDGEFANVSVLSATRRGGNQFDNGYNGAVEISKDHFALGANGLTVSQALVDQVYGTMNYEVTLSDSTVLRFSLVGNSALFTNYDETSIWDGAPNNNGAICQDTGMLSIESVEGDNKLKYTPANATLGHAANGGVHNGAFTFSIVGLHSGWLPITLADGNLTFSFDYSIVLGEKSVSGYSIYYATRSGGEVTELLDATKSNWTKTFAAGELACVKIFCPATAACSFESIQGTYMLIDNVNLYVTSDGARLLESSKTISHTDESVKIAGEFTVEGLSVVSVTRQGALSYDNGDSGYNTPATLNANYVTLSADGITLSSKLISQIYGTQNIAIVLSNGKTLNVALTSDQALFNNYDETNIYINERNVNWGICQDTGMLSIENVNGDNKLKYSPESATLGHAANGGEHNGAFTLSVSGRHAGWTEIALANDKETVVSFDYSIVLGEKTASAYAIYYETVSGGAAVELLDASQTNWSKTFAAGELKCLKIYCPASANCSYADIQGTYMLIDNISIVNK